MFFAKRGELASNRHEDHETTMLSLHLLQNSLVYINTLMMQQVLARPHWQRRLTALDQRALTPLIWEHVNSYGRYELDMGATCVGLDYRAGRDGPPAESILVLARPRTIGARCAVR